MYYFLFLVYEFFDEIRFDVYFVIIEVEIVEGNYIVDDFNYNECVFCMCVG